MNKTLSIIIPAYNEEKTIDAILKKVLAVPLPGGLLKEVVVVDDGSTDKTMRVLNDYADDARVRFFHKLNGGKASALKLGLQKAAGDIFLIQDADMEYDPAQYPQLLAPILEGRSQVVYGSRFLGKIEQMKLINRLANRISNKTMKLLWGGTITDINTCYKVFTKEAFAGITIMSRNFAFETEITLKFMKKGLTIEEVPIAYQARTAKEGKKIRWGTALEMYWPIIAQKFRRD